MPLDPSIALGYKPPQVNLDVPSPIQQFGQVMSLRGLMEQSQMRQMQMQQERMQMDKAQRAVQDDQILRQSYRDAAGDLDKTQQFVMQRGGSPQALQALQQHQLNLRKTTSEIDKNELPTLQFRNDQTIGLIKQAQGLSPDQYAQQYPTLAKQWQQINPKEQLPPAMIPQDQLGTLLLGHQTQKQLLEEAKAKQEAAESAAKIEQYKSEAQKNVLSAQQQRQFLDAQVLASALRTGGQPMLDKAIAGLPTDERRAPFQGAKSVDDIFGSLLTAEQRQQAAQFGITSAEAKRHNLSTESIARVNAAVNQGRLAQEKIINGIKYGPGTSEFWTQQLYDNPDSIKELPPEMKSVVGQQFKQKFDLPLPTPLGDTAKGTETAARNARDQITWIRNAMQDPEIQSRIGPLMGRLGEAEQDAGATVGLSPAAAQKAQALRSRARYLLLQEGKSLIGGRMSKGMMDEFEKSSARTSMDPAMLEGALQAADGSAQDIIQNLDRQRFGGKARGTQTAPTTTRKPLGDILGTSSQTNTPTRKPLGQIFK